MISTCAVILSEKTVERTIPNRTSRRGDIAVFVLRA
jgi:hypothetical protein